MSGFGYSNDGYEKAKRDEKHQNHLEQVAKVGTMAAVALAKVNIYIHLLYPIITLYLACCDISLDMISVREA